MDEGDKLPMAAAEWRIRPGEAVAFLVAAGHTMRIIDVDGKQMAALVALSRKNPIESVSVAATRTGSAHLLPRVGMMLLSGRREPMLELIEDTVGRHDMLIAACDPQRYTAIGEPQHANCREALVAALAPYGMVYDRLPDPINWFMNVQVVGDGELRIEEPLSRSGDHVMLRAVDDVIVAVAACPHDKNPTNGFAPSDVMVRVDEPSVSPWSRDAGDPHSP